MDINKIKQVNEEEDKENPDRSEFGIEKEPVKNIRDTIKKELKEKYGIDKEPPVVDIEIFYSGHEKPEDLEGFDLEGVDILLPEFAGWGMAQQNTWNLSTNKDKKKRRPPEDFGNFDSALQKFSYDKVNGGKDLAVGFDWRD